MRDCTYIAADFDHDEDAVDILKTMKKKGYIIFKDAHELQQSRDSSLACSIKKSLRKRMDCSKKFILIVGEHTNSISKGGCQICPSYNSHNCSCARGYSVDYRSFIKFECDIAKESANYIDIVVLYKDTKIDKELCPESIKNLGVHSAMIHRGVDGKLYWDYEKISKAIGT